MEWRSEFGAKGAIQKEGHSAASLWRPGSHSWCPWREKRSLSHGSPGQGQRLRFKLSLTFGLSVQCLFSDQVRSFPALLLSAPSEGRRVLA